jgi:hypothetical protein
MSANLRLSVIAVALALLKMSGGAVVPRLSDGGSWFQGAIAQEASAHTGGSGSKGGGSSGGHETGGSSGTSHESGASSGGHTGGSSGMGGSGGMGGGGSSGGHESSASAGGHTSGDSGGGCGGGCGGGGGEEGGGHKGGTEEKGHGLKRHHGGHASGAHQGNEPGQYMGPRRFAGGTGTALHALVPEGLGRYGGGAPSDRGRTRYWGGWTFPDEPPVVPPDEPPVVPPVVPPPVVTPDDPPVVPPPVVTPDEPPAAPPPVASTDPTTTTDTTHTTTDTTHTTDSSHETDSTHTTESSGEAGSSKLASEQPGRYGMNAPGDERGRYGYRGGRVVEPVAIADVEPSGAGAGPSVNVGGALFSAERCDGTGGGMTTAQRYSDKNLRRASAAYAQLDPEVKTPVANKAAALLVNFQEELEKPKPDLIVAGVYVGLLARTPVTPDKVKSVCAHLCMSIPDKQAKEIAETAELQRTSSN